MKLVTVFTTLYPAEADLVNSRLDAANFHPFVAQELSALSTGGYSLATGGIKVQVPEDEEKDAREFLASPPESPSSPTDA